MRLSAAAAAPDGDTGAAVAARPSLLPDAALALGLVLLTSLALLHRHHGAAWWLWLLNALLLLPLTFRRRYPSAVFAVVAATALVQWSAGEPLLGDVALLIAIYTVAAYEDRRRALLAAGVLEVGIILASIRFSPAGDGIIASIVFLTGLLTGALFLGTTVRTRRAYLESLEDRAQRLERERYSQARLAATQERTRIAREMHDIVAHSLSVMISLADGAALTNETDPATARTAMRAVSGTGRTALAEMRRLLGVLRDEGSEGQLAPQPGLAQLDQLIDSVRTAGLPVRFTVTGVPAELPPTKQTAIYRVVQEALTNVLKHGTDVNTVAVEMTWTADAFAIDVCDDGRKQAVNGTASTAADAGHGLTGMRERVALHGGTMFVGPGPTRGWRVHARLPLEETQ